VHKNESLSGTITYRNESLNNIFLPRNESMSTQLPDTGTAPSQDKRVNRKVVKKLLYTKKMRI